MVTHEYAILPLLVVFGHSNKKRWSLTQCLSSHNSGTVINTEMLAHVKI